MLKSKKYLDTKRKYTIFVVQERKKRVLTTKKENYGKA